MIKQQFQQTIIYFVENFKQFLITSSGNEKIIIPFITCRCGSILLQ